MAKLRDPSRVLDRLSAKKTGVSWATQPPSSNANRLAGGCASRRYHLVPGLDAYVLTALASPAFVSRAGGGAEALSPLIAPHKLSLIFSTT